MSLALFIYLRFYITFNTVQVISRRVVGRAEETSTYSSLGLCTVNCRPTANNYQLSRLRLSRGWNPGLRGGKCPLQISRLFSVTRMYVHIQWDVREALGKVILDLSKGRFFTFFLHFCIHETKVRNVQCHHFFT